MTDRIKGFTVVLEEPLRDDDAEAIINAIRMVKGVMEVTPHIQTADDYYAEARARAKFRRKIYDFLEDQKDEA